jgi:hypothetical protein
MLDEGYKPRRETENSGKWNENEGISSDYPELEKNSKRAFKKMVRRNLVSSLPFPLFL